MYLMVVRDQDRLFALCQLLLPVIKYSKNLIQNYNAQIGDRMGHSLSFWKIYTFSKSMLITFTVLLNQEAGFIAVFQNNTDSCCIYRIIVGWTHNSTTITFVKSLMQGTAVVIMILCIWTWHISPLCF